MNPSVTHDLSIISLIADASLLVQLVMGALLLASLFSWYYIFLKRFQLRRADKQTDEFEKQFWSGADLASLYHRANAARHPGTLERVFEAGFREFTKLTKQPGMDVAAVMDGTRRAMRATYQREMDSLESHLSFLASVGSVSPYVGLFGTVWGIMMAFMNIGLQGSTDLAVVSGPIAEALIATAMGLFAAIPAVYFYNHFTSKVKGYASEMDDFALEFLNISERNFT